MDKHIILGVHVTDRLKNAPMVQALLTEYAATSRRDSACTRWTATPAAQNGLLLLELVARSISAWSWRRG